MTSNSYNSAIQYNPNPPRVWSRVQHSCSIISYKDNDPAANSNFAKAEYDRQMLLKGNILQYKKNSSNLTKKQRYTQIAKGMWTNRTKTWATQSDTYTNPNMTSLLRVNYNILDPSNNTFSSPLNPFGCPTTVIQDGGNLVCNVVVDPCTQKIIKRTKSQQLCNPTSDSDVPGRIQELCWNDGTQTWYPRQRYIMPTSGTKWPEGYKGFTSALTFVGPILSVGTMTCGQLDIPLSWTFLDSTCAPISSFNIYQNNLLILNVPVTETTVTITGNSPGTYSYYVTSVSSTFESEKSNILIVNIQYNYISENAIITNNGKTITFLQNGSIKFYCSINNVSITIVAGGGGGGKGATNVYICGGGGGGGGGGIFSNIVNFSPDTYNIVVGNQGIGSADTLYNNGRGGDGGNSYIQNSSLVYIGSLTTGGLGGSSTQAFQSGQSQGGIAGGPTSGGYGGKGGNNSTTAAAANGQNGTYPYSGGGGGGGGGDEGSKGGSGAYYSIGGTGAVLNTSNGGSAYYGGGGGGGGCGGGNGGNGGSGIVILNIP